jgi:hypothetical protein
MERLAQAFEAIEKEIATPEPPTCKAWSAPMSKAEMGARVKLTSMRRFNAFAKHHKIRPAGNRQLWQICLDAMDEATRQSLKRPS